MVTTPRTPEARPGQPLAVKLAAIIAGLVVLGLTLAGALTTVALRVKLVAEIDRQLAQTLPTLTARGQFEAAMSGPSDYVLMVFADDAVALATITGLGHVSTDRPAIDELSPARTRELAGRAFTVKSTAGDGQWRCLAALAELKMGPPGRPPGGVDDLGALGSPDRADGGQASPSADSGDLSRAGRISAVAWDDVLAAGGGLADPGAGGAITDTAAVGDQGLRSVVLALPLASVADTTEQMALVVVWLILAVAVLATASGYAMVRRSLGPLRDVERAAARIATGDLAVRVPPARPGTEVGRLTDSLNVMLTQIEAAFAAQTASEARMRTFVSDASHELRTPLAAIRGYAELFRMGGLVDPASLDGAMRRIEDEAARMGAMVGDLATLARLTESPSLTLTPVDLAVLAADAVADAKALDPSRTVLLVAEPESVPPVAGDEAALRRVFANLVTNAVKYTAPGSPIELAVARSAEGGAVAEIRDHGPGIPPDKRAQVFDRFFRLEHSRSRDLGGSGLGLAIVAGLVAAHGGRVEVAETPGGGATFRFVLPPNRLDRGKAVPAIRGQIG